MEHNFEVQRYCVIKYLSKIRYIDEDLKHVRDRISEIEQSLVLSGVSYDKIGSAPSTTGDKIPDGILRLMDKREELQMKLSLHFGLLDEARELCPPSNRPRWCLWLHYVDGYDWSSVGKKLGYSERHTRLMACTGIREIYELMPEEFRRYTIPNAAPE